MKKKIIMFSLMLLLIVLFVVTICFADNPIVQTNYTADPAPMVYNNTFYVYTGHDEDSAGGWFYMKDWRCYSSTDMANWTDLGSPMSLTTFSWAASDAWASQCVYRNGKFYFYATVKPKTGGWAIGVGVSTNPAGPFADALGYPLVSYTDYYIDPTVFIDDDGQAYMYWGNPYCYYVKLNEDMISTSGSIATVPENATTLGNRYAEAPWLYKRNGLYYLAFAGDGQPGVEDICYSTGPSPTGPWTFRGRIMAPTGCWTIHPGIADYKGNSYFVYHNAALPGAGSGGFRRSVCIEKFTYNADGTIPLINMTTSGPPQIGALNPYVRTEAETICWESGVETESCSEGGMDVGNIENGDYIKVKGVDFGSGATSFETRVASATSGGNIELRLDSSTGTLVGTCAVSGTGGWQTWVTKSCTVSGATGNHDLYLKFTGGSGFLFNVNWWQFNSSGSTPTPTPTPVATATPTPTGGTVNRVYSYNFPTYYIRHLAVGAQARIDPNVTPIEDSQWKIVPGLADSSCVSFESVNYPGYFLRHSGYLIYLNQNDGSAIFKSDATFREVAGLKDSAWKSYQSYNFPDRYLRHYAYLLKIDPLSGSSSDTDKQDATFKRQ